MQVCRCQCLKPAQDGQLYTPLMRLLQRMLLPESLSRAQVTLLVAYYLLAGALLQWVLASSAGQQMAWQLPAPEAERIVEAKRWALTNAYLN